MDPKSIKVIVRIGKPDAKDVPFVETTADVFKRSAVFGPLLDANEAEQEVFLGKDFNKEDVQIIMDFIKFCHVDGKTEDPPEPEKWSPKDKDIAAKFEIPAPALDLLNIKKAGTEIIDFQRLLQISSVAHFLKMVHIIEGVAQNIAAAIKDKSPEEIQEMLGKEKKFTEEMEQEVIKKFPWLA
jgi:hypothetical protein